MTGPLSAFWHTPAMRDPWELAHEAAATSGVTLRRLDGVEDGDAVNEVIERTWGGQHLDREIVRALGFSGNAVLGAEDGGRVVGFALGWAGVDEDGLHVHSHMLATLPDARRRGIGYALKLAQRALALDQGITRMRWTFDPMVARNAWFNLGKLGAVADRFYPDFYGPMTDAINAGERSDRLVIRWDLPREPGPRDPGGDAVRIEVPPDHERLRVDDPAAATARRTEVASRIRAATDEGRHGIAFDRDASAYLFAREEGAS